MPLFCFMIFREPEGTRASQTTETGKTVPCEASYSNGFFVQMVNAPGVKLNLIKIHIQRIVKDEYHGTNDLRYEN